MSGSGALAQTRQAMARLGEAGLGWSELVPEVIGALRRVVGFDCWCMALNDPRTPMPAAYHADNPVLASRQQRFWQIEMQVPDVNKTCHLAVGRRAVGVLSAATGGDLARSRRWEELLGPGGVGDELQVALVLDGYWWGSLILYRDRGGRWFTAADAATLTALATPLAAAARRAWTSGTAWADPLEAGAVPPAPDAPGTLLVSVDGTPVTATAQAEAWLARIPVARLGRGSLTWALAARLGARDGPFGGATDSVRSLTRDVAGRWVEFDATRLRTPLSGAAIAITIQAARPTAVTGLLTHAFALTPREREVAALALAGRSTAQIGAELFLSHHTVADHLKAIFAKSGAHSRHDLARRLTGSPV